MTTLSTDPLSRAADWRLRTRLGILLLVVVIATAAGSAVAYAQCGPAGLLVVAFAAGVCLLGSSLAVTLAHLLRGPQLAMFPLFGGMVSQTGIPLVAGGLLSSQVWFVEARGLWWLVGFFVITLSTKTLLILPLIQPAPLPARKPSGKAG